MTLRSDPEMMTSSAEELAGLRDSVRGVLASRGTEADVRAAMETPAGYDPSLWQQLAGLGIAGLVVPAEYGGSGAGPVELEAVTEEAGAALLCSPLLGSSVLAAALLTESGDRAAQAALLPAIAAGTGIVAAAVTGPAGTWTADAVEVTAAEAGGGWALDGVADYVLGGQNAGTLLVAAREPAGLTWFVVAPEDAEITGLPTFDHTLRLARVRLSAAPATLLGERGAGWVTAERALNLARVALAGEQAGGARRSLDMTVAYSKARVQFGRPIGSFQAIKHLAADLLLEAESAISAARHAARELAAGADGAQLAVDLAAFACADAFTAVTAASVQMHGGIAFTWDHPAHLYLRRARADAQLLGTPSFYRERYVQQLGG
ncbi:MAG TPA: acyl-CoA dehydrogenase family protein [Streptosporangiaceae bacterium]